MGVSIDTTVYSQVGMCGGLNGPNRLPESETWGEPDTGLSWDSWRGRDFARKGDADPCALP